MNIIFFLYASSFCANFTMKIVGVIFSMPNKTVFTEINL